MCDLKSFHQIDDDDFKDEKYMLLLLLMMMMLFCGYYRELSCWWRCVVLFSLFSTCLNGNGFHSKSCSTCIPCFLKTTTTKMKTTERWFSSLILCLRCVCCSLRMCLWCVNECCWTERERERGSWKSVYYYAKCHHRLVFNSFGGRKEDTSDMKNDSSSSTAFFISYDDIKYLSQLILIALIA